MIAKFEVIDYRLATCLVARRRLLGLSGQWLFPGTSPYWQLSCLVSFGMMIKCDSYQLHKKINIAAASPFYNEVSDWSIN